MEVPMKQLFLFAVVVCLIAMILPTCAPAPNPEPEPTPEPEFDQAAEEAAIRSAVEEIFASFNRRDLEAYGELWEDGYFDFTGASSREQNKKWAEEAFANYKDIQAEQIKEIGIDFLKPDVAIQRRAMTFTSSSGPDGKPVPTFYGLRSSVFMKKNGKWIVVAQFGRPMTEEEIKQLSKQG
jgi:ketosteroid isomerase-like protein